MSETLEKKKKLDISVVLVRPSRPGNIGAVSRIMANFSFKKLILVNLDCDYLDVDALKRSKHGISVLKSAKIVKNFDDLDFDYLVATSGKLGSDYNIPRLPLEPRVLAEKIANFKQTSLALVFGPEPSGLLNKEIEACDLFVSIPASDEYPILNLSHAVTLILYEIFLSSKNKFDTYAPISKKNKDVLKSQVNEILDTLDFETKEKRQTQVLLWQRLIAKSFLTKREAFALMGFFKKILRKR